MLKTRDIGLAAYLILKGFTLDKFVREGDRIYILFSGDMRQLEQAQMDYMTNNESSKVAARQFWETYQSLRSLLISYTRKEPVSDKLFE